MTVALDVLISRATALIDAPSDSRCSAFCRCSPSNTGLRPNVFPSALARAFGATPYQVSAGLTAAQMIPALLAGILSVPAGISLYRFAARVAGGAPNANLPASWMAAVIVGTVVVVAALTLFPARAGARRPVAAVLRSD